MQKQSGEQTRSFEQEHLDASLLIMWLGLANRAFEGLQVRWGMPHVRVGSDDVGASTPPPRVQPADHCAAARPGKSVRPRCADGRASPLPPRPAQPRARSRHRLPSPAALHSSCAGPRSRPVRNSMQFSRCRCVGVLLDVPYGILHMQINQSQDCR